MPGTLATSKAAKTRKGLKVFFLIVLFAALAGLGYIGVKLYKLRKERQEEKKSALIEEGDFENDDEEEGDNNTSKNDGGSFVSAS